MNERAKGERGRAHALYHNRDLAPAITAQAQSKVAREIERVRARLFDYDYAVACASRMNETALAVRSFIHAPARFRKRPFTPSRDSFHGANEKVLGDFIRNRD